MIGLFKNNNPLALLLLALLAILPGFFGDTKVTAALPAGSTALFDYFAGLDHVLLQYNSLLHTTINSSLVLVEALLLNKIISDHKLMDRPGFIPAMAFLLLNALLPFNITTTYLILIGVMLLVLKILMVMYKQSKPNNQLLLVGFMMGSMAGLNTSYLLLFPWITIGIMIMRPASVRESLISGLGFVMPFYFLASMLYLTDRFDPSNIFPAFTIDFGLPALPPLTWAKTILFLTFPWVGILLYNKEIGKMVIQGRKAYLLMLLLNMALMLICFLSFKSISTNFALMLVPSTLMFAPFFLSFKRDFIPNIVLLSLIALSFLR